jgi:hypothetical protein
MSNTLASHTPWQFEAAGVNPDSAIIHDNQSFRMQ